MSGNNVLLASEHGIYIASIDDIMDALAICGAESGLVITEQELDPLFFDLATGLAGELFQKCSNYRQQVALVIPDPSRYGSKIRELAYEHSQHPVIRFVKSLEEAMNWLS
jgi:hypothetical protein